MSHVPKNKSVTAAGVHFLHRYAPVTQRRGRCTHVCRVSCRLQHPTNADYDLHATLLPTSVREPASQGFRSCVSILHLANTNTAGMVVTVESYLASREIISEDSSSDTGEGVRFVLELDVS